MLEERDEIYKSFEFHLLLSDGHIEQLESFPMSSAVVNLHDGNNSLKSPSSENEMVNLAIWLFFILIHYICIE